MSQTKQARGDSGKEPKLHQVKEWREKKNLGRNHWLSRGAGSPLGNERTVYEYEIGIIIGQKSDWNQNIQNI